MSTERDSKTISRRPVPGESSSSTLAVNRSPKVREVAESIAFTGNGNQHPDVDDILPALSRISLDNPRPTRKSARKSSLDKPLPPLPLKPNSSRHSVPTHTKPDVAADSHLPIQKLRDSGIDLTHTEDLETTRGFAPAVTHETIIENVHEIKQEVITREIHEDEYYHRILPIQDVEVLPPRHFVKGNDGSLKEISGRQLVAGSAEKVREQMAKHFKPQATPEYADSSAEGRRMFSARTFDNSEFRTKQTQTGSLTRTDQWWVHPPTLSTGARDAGQTRPFYLGFPNPQDNGLR